MVMINNPTFIADNAECIKILTELGLVDKLQPQSPWTRAHTYFEYKDCWCAAAYDKGHKEEKDNGFSIIMLPKGLMTAEAAYQLLKEVFDNTLEPGWEGTGEMRFVPIGKERQ